MRGVDDPHTAVVRRRDVEPVAEAIAVELSEQRQMRRGCDDLGADERGTVADDERVQARGERRQAGLGLGVPRSRASRPDATENGRKQKSATASRRARSSAST